MPKPGMKRVPPHAETLETSGIEKPDIKVEAKKFLTGTKTTRCNLKLPIEIDQLLEFAQVYLYLTERVSVSKADILEKAISEYLAINNYSSLVSPISPEPNPKDSVLPEGFVRPNDTTDVCFYTYGALWGYAKAVAQNERRPVFELVNDAIYDYASRNGLMEKIACIKGA